MNRFFSIYRRALPARLLVFAIAFLVAGACYAADVDGKWSGSVSTPNGDIPQAFTFKAAGAALTGSMAAPDGSQIAIKDGKVDGGNISFSVTLDFGGMPVTLNYKGEVSAEQIKLTGDFMGQPFQILLKKAAS